MLEIDCFKRKGRIGRVKYFGQSTFWLICLESSRWFFIKSPEGSISQWIAIAIIIISFINEVFLATRRLNDAGYNNSFFSMKITPKKDGMNVTKLFFSPGTSGENAYGPPPAPPTIMDHIFLYFIIIAAIFLFIVLKYYDPSYNMFGHRRISEIIKSDPNCKP